MCACVCVYVCDGSGGCADDSSDLAECLTLTASPEVRNQSVQQIKLIPAILRTD